MNLRKKQILIIGLLLSTVVSTEGQTMNDFKKSLVKGVTGLELDSKSASTVFANPSLASPLQVLSPTINQSNVMNKSEAVGELISALKENEDPKKNLGDIFDQVQEKVVDKKSEELLTTFSKSTPTKKQALKILLKTGSDTTNNTQGLENKVEVVEHFEEFKVLFKDVEQKEENINVGEKCKGFYGNQFSKEIFQSAYYVMVDLKLEEPTKDHINGALAFMDCGKKDPSLEHINMWIEKKNERKVIVALVAVNLDITHLNKEAAATCMNVGIGLPSVDQINGAKAFLDRMYDKPSKEQITQWVEKVNDRDALVALAVANVTPTIETIAATKQCIVVGILAPTTAQIQAALELQKSQHGALAKVEPSKDWIQAVSKGIDDLQRAEIAWALKTGWSGLEIGTIPGAIAIIENIGWGIVSKDVTFRIIPVKEQTDEFLFVNGSKKRMVENSNNHFLVKSGKLGEYKNIKEKDIFVLESLKIDGKEKDFVLFNKFGKHSVN